MMNSVLKEFVEGVEGVPSQAWAYSTSATHARKVAHEIKQLQSKLDSVILTSSELLEELSFAPLILRVRLGGREDALERAIEIAEIE